MACALKAGLVGSLEALLRETARREDGAAACLSVLNTVLRGSGVWPAVLTHGPALEVASIIVTLRNVTRVLQNREIRGPVCAAGCGPAAELDMSGISISSNMGAAAGQLSLAYMAALIEQTAVALLPPPQLCIPSADLPADGESSSSSGGEASGSSGGAASRRLRDFGRALDAPGGGGSADGGVAGRLRGRWHPLQLNQSLEVPGAGAVSLDWMVAAAGSVPARGVHARRQELKLRAVTVMTLLPTVISNLLPVPGLMRLSWAVQVWRVALRWAAALLAQASICSALALGRAMPAGDERECSGLQRGWADAVRELDAEDMRIERELLLGFVVDNLNVLCWLGPLLQREIDVEALQGGPVFEVALLALDVLEVLVDLAPDEVAGRVITNDVVRHPTWADGPILLDSRLESLMLRSGRGELFGALMDLSDPGGKEEQGEEGRGGEGAIAAGAGEARTPAAERLVLRYGTCRLPWFDCSFVVGADVVACMNPDCSCLDGPSAAQLKTRECARCHSFIYCCGICQLNHWRSGHQEERTRR
jgi:hypothetical protein